MDAVTGRAAVVTGGGSGIGRAIVLALAEAGADVVVADIELDAAETVAKEAQALGVDALPFRVDVADTASVDALADASFDRFGAVHILCNNAGVFLMGQTSDFIVDDWRWVLSVNVIGVVNGVHAFLPRMIAQGQPGHIVNTGSVASFGGGGPYGASKAAVLSITESLHGELAPHGIGASVLCPANINSRILGAQRNRPAEFGRKAAEPFGTDFTTFGIDAEHVGRRALEAILNDELYVFVFPDGWQDHLKPGAAKRFNDVLEAIDRGAVPDGGAPS
jgi:NAD(P)-dependent dehydrogenase (short-subunit alcohol dehydrogenase family)